MLGLSISNFLSQSTLFVLKLLLVFINSVNSNPTVCRSRNLLHFPTGNVIPNVTDVPELSVKAFAHCCESSDGDPCPARCGRRPTVASRHTSWYVYSAVLAAAAGVTALTFIVACLFNSRKARGDGGAQDRLSCFGNLKRLVGSTKKPGLTV